MQVFWLIVVGLMGISFTGQAQPPSEQVSHTLKAYAKAIESRDLVKIASLVDTTEQFSVFESGHVNIGWQDYRDHHLAPELKAFQAIQYRFQNIQVQAAENLAVATLRYTIHVTLPQKEISARGVGTFVLVRQPDGWKIQHIHTTRSRDKH